MANSWYGTTGAAATYYTTMGYAGAEATDADLLVASVWLDSHYMTMYPGRRTYGRAQPREWPRDMAQDIYCNPIDPATVPIEIENATYELARINNADPGALYVSYTPGEDVKSLSIDGALSLTFAGASSVYDVQVQLPMLSALLYPILNKNPALANGISSFGVRG